MKSPRFLCAAAAFAVTASFAQAATETVPAIPAKAPGSVAVLLGVDSVRKELHLTSLQRAVLNDIRNEYRDDARDIVAKAKADLESKKQAQSKLDALTASSERRALRVLNDDQRQRLTEIQYQIRGGYELLSPVLQQKLELTAEQKAKIAKIYIRGEKYTSKVNAKFEKGQISLYQRLLDLRENRLDRSDDFLAVLTEEQYSKFLQLEGKEFSGLNPGLSLN
jgi:Spy/CpxP family protein refolding chaperone